MKKILLLALLFVSTFASAQNIKNDGEPYEVYCAFYGTAGMREYNQKKAHLTKKRALYMGTDEIVFR